ncbi:MAG: hypothetical protein M0D57_19895 [Sphingobacteriales bacterium JAD_PAG50586_3]|nr:MAG: hypothetical protein M0D57_19895 [Sphingobacteriales bacterium JAD_PAG50586_3]
MESNQIKLLATLAKAIKLEEKNRDKIVLTLQSAKIITQNENFTGHYSNLEKVVSVAE